MSNFALEMMRNIKKTTKRYTKVIMKYLNYILLMLPLLLNAQVGIGTTSPNAKLDIRASNQVTPTNNDGLLIPKIDEYPATNPTALQDGLLVFVTGNGIVTKGFYYWDNTSTSWVVATGAKKIDDLSDGKSDGHSVFLGVNAGLNNSINRNNVGIGFESLKNNTSGNFNTATGLESLLSNTTGNSNTANGNWALRSNIIGDYNTAIGDWTLYNSQGDANTSLGFQSLISNTTGNNNLALGAFSGFSNTGSSNIFIGNRAGFNEIGSNKLYIENSQTTTPLIYGEFDANKLRINGELQIGDPITTGYKLPTIDGAANQVLETDGTGTITWKDNSFIGDNPKYPDGLRNIQPVIHSFNNGDYTVPIGKNFYITGIYSQSPGGRVFINGLQVQRGVNNSFHTNVHYHSSINNPIIAKPGDVISGIQNLNNAVNGFLVNAKVTPIAIQANNYVVPNGKILVIMSVYSNEIINYTIDNISFYLGRGNFSVFAGGPASMYTGLYAPIFADEGSVVTSMNMQNTGVFGNIIGYLKDK